MHIGPTRPSYMLNGIMRTMVIALVLLGSVATPVLFCSCGEQCGACEAVDRYLVAIRDGDEPAAASWRYQGENADHLRNWLAEHWRSKHDYCWTDTAMNTSLPVGLKAKSWTPPKPTEEWKLSIPPLQDHEPMPEEALGADMREGAYIFTRVSGRRKDGALASMAVNFVVVRVGGGWKVFCQL